MKTLKLTAYNDPGHGWLRVPNKLLVELEIANKISAYSYMTQKYSYLEEDCDALKFINAAKSAGYDVKITDKYSDGEAACRSYCGYKSEHVLNPTSTNVGDLIRIHTGQMLEVTGHKGTKIYFKDINGNQYQTNKNTLLQTLW